jgi:hypothetical protein
MSFMTRGEGNPSVTQEKPRFYSFLFDTLLFGNKRAININGKTQKERREVLTERDRLWE